MNSNGIILFCMSVMGIRFLDNIPICYKIEECEPWEIALLVVWQKTRQVLLVSSHWGMQMLDCILFVKAPTRVIFGLKDRQHSTRACGKRHWDLENIDQFYKSQNVPVPYPTMLHSEQKCAISVLNGALWVMELVHSGIWELEQLKRSHVVKMKSVRDAACF